MPTSERKKMDKRQYLINAVLDQIQADVANGDLTAIEELIRNLPVDILQGFLPEAALDQNGQLFG